MNIKGREWWKVLMFHVLSVAEERDIKRLYSEVSITARPFL